ncbi:MAG: toll/interleukin-1 receptor domain-containing protein [Chitinophagaceae bacterium]|nr:toll/interleukin-1 receptor domain-containing protein [Chitinophagaceae bacterium]
MNLNFLILKRKIFISHADEDSEIAHNIAALIKRALNVEVALDKFFLYAGDDWKAKINIELDHQRLL